MRARIQEMNTHKNDPEYLLNLGGFMNEYIQAYVLNHNYNATFVPNSEPNPDTMTYEVCMRAFSNLSSWARKSARSREG